MHNIEQQNRVSNSIGVRYDLVLKRGAIPVVDKNIFLSLQNPGPGPNRSQGSVSVSSRFRIGFLSGRLRFRRNQAAPVRYQPRFGFCLSGPETDPIGGGTGQIGIPSAPMQSPCESNLSQDGPIGFESESTRADPSRAKPSWPTRAEPGLVLGLELTLPFCYDYQWTGKNWYFQIYE